LRRLVCPPGSGKSTYCAGLHQFLTAWGRPVQIVNLDPANYTLPYPCALNIADLITLEDVMREEGLGPNGAMLYVMEYLEQNIDWLVNGLRGLEGDYVVFDVPGQVRR
jgi:GTPase SAR1 family protein